MEFLRLAEKMKWPPQEWSPERAKIAEWSAWYSGDTETLSTYYRNVSVLKNTWKGRFWAKTFEDENRPLVHVPIASDIAGVSSDLLFSEQPSIYFPDAQGKNNAMKAQTKLDEIIERTGFMSKLLEIGEVSAGLGGVYMKIDWDTEDAEYPVVNICQPDLAYPTFDITGSLKSVSFVRLLEGRGNKVYRHVEYREKGLIEHSLFVGSEVNLGIYSDLSGHDETAMLEPEIKTGIDDPLVRYVPNRLPNRLFRGSRLGMSDFCGQEALMDSLDETFSLWIDDIRRARGRIIIPEQWLEKSDATGKFMFKEDRTVFVRLPNMGPPGEEGASPITVQQFAIRSQEHRDTVIELLDRIVTSSGYSPQSFGLNIEGRAESGTALRIRERKSLKTQQKKASYFKSRIEDILSLVMQVDKVILDNDTITLYRPRVEFADSIQESFDELARSVLQIHQAESASIQTKVEMLHPEWSQEEVDAETTRIMDQQGMNVAEPDWKV